MEIIDPANGLLAKRHDDVTFADVCAPGWTLRVDGNHQHAALRAELVKTDETSVEWDVLAADPQGPCCMNRTWPAAIPTQLLVTA